MMSDQPLALRSQAIAAQSCTSLQGDSMKRSVLPITACLVLLLSLLAALAPELLAQIATVKGPGKWKEPFLFVQQDLPAQSDVSVFVVPNGRTLVITDFIVSNGAVSNTLVQLNQKTGLTLQRMTHPILMSASQTQSFQFSTGLTFEAGTEVVVGTGSQNQALSITLLGYLRK